MGLIYIAPHGKMKMKYKHRTDDTIMTKLVIIVPCYNEQEVLASSAQQLLDTLKGLIATGKLHDDSALLFVNDGSRDATWSIIQELHAGDKHVLGLNLAANVGHQNALFAGIDIMKERFDASITIDADLQDDIAAIEEMVELYNAGEADIVYGVRSDRSSDTAFKRGTAQAFYKFMNFLGAKTVYNHADYRLMSRRAMEQLARYKERNLFLRGIVPKIGYKTASVYYTRKKRTAGESKYPLKKMLSFAWDGITSLSIKPISLIVGLGLAVTGTAFIALIYILISYFCGNTISGWPSLMISIWFLGGLQLFAIGVIGQYVGKTYIESKERPRYTVEELLTHDDEA